MSRKKGPSASDVWKAKRSAFWSWFSSLRIEDPKENRTEEEE